MTPQRPLFLLSQHCKTLDRCKQGRPVDLVVVAEQASDEPDLLQGAGSIE